MLRFLLMALVSMAGWMAIGLGLGCPSHWLIPAIDLGNGDAQSGSSRWGAAFCGSAGFRPWRPSTVTTTANGLI